MLQYLNIFREFYDTFSWTYDDLKEYKKYIFQHVIPLKEEAVPVRKNPRTINPKLKPLIKLELEKMEKAGIIFFVEHPEWISNMVVVRKKNREIHLCVDF
jgi:hypothetical protein